MVQTPPLVSGSEPALAEPAAHPLVERYLEHVRVEKRLAQRTVELYALDLHKLQNNALQAGASGFLLKDAPPEELVHAIRVIAAGDALLAPSVTRRLLDTFASQRRVNETSPVAREAVSRLTDREREVLLHMARGLSNNEVATAMYLGETTVKTYVGRILSKLAARDRVQAVVTAFDAGLVVPAKE